MTKNSKNRIVLTNQQQRNSQIDWRHLKVYNTHGKDLQSHGSLYQLEKVTHKGDTAVAECIRASGWRSSRQ